ncbi:MAG: ATP-binding protein, partial [Ignavibacteria bacterium]|nr:ATP-binding protein [Ignavibacteria bacterium]
MYLKKIHVENFRCFENMEMELDHNFNMIVGVNGTGKTAVLEAIRIAIGSLFLRVDKYNGKISSPGISANDVRLSHLERIYPVKIQTDAVVDDWSDISWERSLETHGGDTKKIKAKDIEMYSGLIMTRIRANEKENNNPLICYFSTERYKKDLNDFKIQPQGS